MNQGEARASPPSLSAAQIVLVIGGGVLLLAIVMLAGLWLMSSFLRSSEFGRGADQMFGDQNLKTVVALLELHETRYGEYPAELADLKFTGQWDAIAIQAAVYCASDERDSYYVEIQRGWVGKPELTPRDEFWKGTGYDPSLGPCDK